jgi:predicted amidohydrolase YtcJ
VVDQNIFMVPVHEISNTKVVLTLFQGEVVHEAGPAR